MIGTEQWFLDLRSTRNTARILEHLAGLNLPLRGRSVLEIGAGIGEITHFFLDRGCTVTAVEPRPENVATMRARYEKAQLWDPSRLSIVQTDADTLEAHHIEPHEVVVCYQVLNGFAQPAQTLANLARYCTDLFLVQAGVDSGAARADDCVWMRTGDANDPRASITGVGCIPTRRWLFRELRQHFEHVYMTATQAHCDRFRIDWREPAEGRAQHRAVFVASRAPLDNPLLEPRVLDVQRYAP